MEDVVRVAAADPGDGSLVPEDRVHPPAVVSLDDESFELT
jgi:hypothetical protein